MPPRSERTLRGTRPSVAVRKTQPTPLERRLQRAERRHEKYSPLPTRSEASQQSFLESQSVTLPVREDYSRRCRLFLDWAEAEALPSLTHQDIETALLEYFDLMFFEGRSAEDGDKLWSAVKFFEPALGRRGDLLMPRLPRALKGWHRLCPAMTRQPLPWLGLLAIISQLLCRGKIAVAVALLLQFSLYLLPGQLSGCGWGSSWPHRGDRCSGGSSFARG